MKLPLSVCRPPHVIVSGARTFATFSDDFVVVPPRQIGIAGDTKQAPLLKALALFLNSDFVAYHQFFTSPQGGIREGRSTLEALKRTPTPLGDLAPQELKQWAGLYDALAASQRELWHAHEKPSLFTHEGDASPHETRIKELEAESNEAVADLLGLADDERCLVRDLVHVRRYLRDGLVPPVAVESPRQDELESYVRRIERELDGFIGDNEGLSHFVTAVISETTGMVSIELMPRKTKATRKGARVLSAASPVAAAFQNVRTRVLAEQGQWLYFERNLFLFDGGCTFIFKPRQRIWWTESQALSDADHLIAEALAPAGADT